MLKMTLTQKWTRGVLVASLAALGVAFQATSAQAATLLTINPTGGLSTGVNPGPITGVAQIAQSAGNAIAVGFNPGPPGGPFVSPSVGSTFTLDYQAKVANLLDANNNILFSYTAATGPQATGQLTVVASFQEVVTSASATAATFQTTGVGTVTFYYNPTFAANDSTGLNFAPGTTGNTLAANTFTTVYTGSVLANFNGAFSVNGSQPVVNLDGSGSNQVPGVNTVQGSGGTIFNAQTTSYSPTFFTSAPPPSLLVSLINSSNNLPFGSAAPAAIFYNNQAGYSSVGSINGGTTGDSLGNLPVGGAPVASNVMFMATANETFTTVPEPSSIIIAGTGIGFAFLTGLRAQRRRNQAIAA